MLVCCDDDHGFTCLVVSVVSTTSIILAVIKKSRMVAVRYQLTPVVLKMAV